MAKVTRRLGRLGVDWVDETGRRRHKTVKSEEEGQVFLGKKLIETGRPPSTDPNVTMLEYAPRWLAVAAVRVRATSLVRYRRVMERQILPGLGLHAVRSITTPILRDWLARLLTTPQAPRRRVRAGRADTKPIAPLGRASAAQALDVTRQILAQALDDGIIESNPALGLAKKLRLTSKSIGRDVKAMTPDQLNTFLKTAEVESPEWLLAFRILAFTGMRLGEAFALRWKDVNERDARVNVESQIREDGVLAPPKSARSRRSVDVGPALLAWIKSERVRRNAVALKGGMGSSSPWILKDWPDDGPTAEAALSARNAIRYSMKSVLERAKLPGHFSPHSFRHTFASIMLSQGKSLTWVSQTLGHETISITSDLYGRWLRAEPGSNAAEFERLIARAK
jgi:integrase